MVVACPTLIGRCVLKRGELGSASSQLRPAMLQTGLQLHAHAKMSGPSIDNEDLGVYAVEYRRSKTSRETREGSFRKLTGRV
jgi:hypothetical protein